MATQVNTHHRRNNLARVITPSSPDYAGFAASYFIWMKPLRIWQFLCVGYSAVYKIMGNWLRSYCCQSCIYLQVYYTDTVYRFHSDQSVVRYDHVRFIHVCNSHVATYNVAEVANSVSHIWRPIWPWLQEWCKCSIYTHTLRTKVHPIPVFCTSVKFESV